MKEYQITFEEYFHANNLIMGWKKWFFPILYWFAMNGFIILLFFLYPLLDKDLEIPLWAVIPILVILTFVTIIRWPKWQKKGLSKMYNTNKEFQRCVKVTFNEDFTEWKSNMGAYKLKWKDLYQFQFDDKMIIVYSGENFGRPIPLRAFESEEEKVKFFKLLEANVEQKK